MVDLTMLLHMAELYGLKLLDRVDNKLVDVAAASVDNTNGSTADVAASLVVYQNNNLQVALQCCFLLSFNEKTKRSSTCWCSTP